MKTIQTLLLAPVLLLPLACSSGGGGGGAKGSTVLPANPAGIPLPGMPLDSALGAVRTMVPTPVDPGDIVGRVFATRLHATLDPGATVGEVNDALVARGMSVVSMLEGVPVLVLRMPPAADEAAAVAAAAELETSSAFAFVSACLAPPSSSAPTPRSATGPSEARSAPSGALAAMRMPAAQNADGLIVFDSSSVFVPCYFPDAAADPRLSNLTMLTSEGGTPSFVFEYYLNWGLQAAGVIGVDASYPEFDPIDPGAPVYGMDVGFLTTMERVWEVSGALEQIASRTLAHTFVLCTTLTYDDPAYDLLPPVERANEAYVWRSRLESLGISGGDFAHFTAAGDTTPSMGGVPDASTNSPYALSESNPDLVAYLRQTSGDEVADQFEELYFGTIPPPVGNLRIVGSSNTGSHARSIFSVPGEELRAVGEGIVAPCSTTTGMCDGEKRRKW